MAGALSIEPVPPADWPALAPFIFESNRLDGDVCCLHSHAGLDVAAYAAELRALAADEACFVAARAQETLVGVAGAEIDLAAGRAWLRGPLVAAGHAFGAVAAPLFDALCARLPTAAAVQDVFLSSACARSLAFFRERGFGNEATFGEYSLTCSPPEARPATAGIEVVAPQPQWRAAIGALHEAEFSRPYVSTQRLFEADAPDEFTRVALCDGAPAGYVRARVDEQWREGYVDFLAVAPAARRHGVATALLRAAVAWSFAQPGVQAVTLTARDDRSAARALYGSFGFRRVRNCIGLRRAPPR